MDAATRTAELKVVHDKILYLMADTGMTNNECLQVIGNVIAALSDGDTQAIRDAILLVTYAAYGSVALNRNDATRGARDNA